MKTAAHSTYTGPGRVCISIGSPRGAPAGYRIYRKLAPTREMLNRGYGRPQFFSEILGKLDPRATWEELYRLTGGVEPVLQCFEKPPFTATNWCHRRMVAEWFLETLGEVVDELTPETRADKDRHAADRLAAKSTPATSPSQLPRRGAVEIVRAEIDRFWHPILARLGEVRTWSWMGLPDRIREQLDVGALVDWQNLQARYADVDGAH